MGWKDTIADESKGSWRDTIADEPIVPSELDSLGRGAAQGVSFGLRDEAAGALKSPSGALKELANKFGADFSDDDIAAYKKERDESRRLDQQAKDANPMSYLAGQAGGAVVPSALTGGAGGVTSLAAQGAAQGIGSSDAEDLSGLAKDAAIGGTIGAATGAASKLLNNAVTSEAAQGLGQKAQGLVQNVAEEVATNPMLSKVAALQPAQKVTGAIQGAIKKIGGDDLGAIGDFVGNQAGRIAAYKTPGLNVAQGVSDAAGLVQKGAQKVADLDLTTIIPKLGKFAPILENAASRGGQSVAATHYILQSSNPEYQKMYAEATRGD